MLETLTGTKLPRFLHFWDVDIDLGFFQKIRITINVMERKFHANFTLGNESSRGRKFQGTKVPGNESSRRRKFQGTKVPPMELSFPGTKVLGYESSSYLHFLIFIGVDYFPCKYLLYKYHIWDVDLHIQFVLAVAFHMHGVDISGSTHHSDLDSDHWVLSNSTSVQYIRCHAITILN